MMRRAVRPLSLLPRRPQQASRALSVQPVVDDVVEVTHTSTAAPQQQQQQQPRSGGFQGETRVLGGAKAVLRNVRTGVPCVCVLGWGGVGLGCVYML